MLTCRLVTLCGCTREIVIDKFLPTISIPLMVRTRLRNFKTKNIYRIFYYRGREDGILIYEEENQYEN